MSSARSVPDSFFFHKSFTNKIREFARAIRLEGENLLAEGCQEKKEEKSTNGREQGGQIVCWDGKCLEG